MDRCRVGLAPPIPYHPGRLLLFTLSGDEG